MNFFSVKVGRRNFFSMWKVYCLHEIFLEKFPLQEFFGGICHPSPLPGFLMVCPLAFLVQQSRTSIILFAPELSTFIVFRTRVIVFVVYSIIFSANPVKPYERCVVPRLVHMADEFLDHSLVS